MADLKLVYKASTLSAAETALDDLEARWRDQYPLAIQSWRNHWQHLSAYLNQYGGLSTRRMQFKPFIASIVN